MATKKHSTKTAHKAGKNIQLSNSTSKAVKGRVKRAGTKTLLIAFIMLIVGAMVGGGTWWIVCRNDCFDLVGQESVSLTLEESYIDQGVKIIAFGRDERQSIEIETNLKTDENGNFYSDEAGVFYIKYKSSCFKYSKLFKVEKVRLISVVEQSEGGE